MASPSITVHIRIVVTVLFSLVAAPVSAQTATYSEAYSIQGFSQPNRTSQVASSMTGIVLSRTAIEGQRVRKGECLARLDRRVHDEKLELARIAKDSLGDLQGAEAELTARNARLIRLQELANRNHATSVELVQAQDEIALANANLMKAKDRLAQAAADHARLLAESGQYCVEAPFDGVVVKFAKEAGEYVGPGEAVVCTIAELETLSVEFVMPRSYRKYFHVGDQVEIVFATSGQTVPGSIKYVSPFPNGETNTYILKASVDNSSGELSAGERCQLKLPSDAYSDSPTDSKLSVRGQ